MEENSSEVKGKGGERWLSERKGTMTVVQDIYDYGMEIRNDQKTQIKTIWTKYNWRKIQNRSKCWEEYFNTTQNKLFRGLLNGR